MKMSLQKWVEYGWLRSHKSSNKEIADLLRIIDRDLQDAAGEISSDWRFGIAYNAALKLCTILLYAEGYRPEKNLQHYRTIQSLPVILGKNMSKMPNIWTPAAVKEMWRSMIMSGVSPKKMYRNSSDM